MKFHVTKATLVATVCSLMMVACGDKDKRQVTTPRGTESGGAADGGHADSGKTAVAHSGDAFPKAPANATLSGRVVWDGDVPRAKKLGITGDAYCENCYKDSGLPTKAEYQIDPKTKGVAHAFVYVVGAENKWKFEVPTESIVLDQKGCRYEPRVFGMMQGQKLVVRSDDETQHNVHFVGKRNRPAKANFTEVKGQEQAVDLKRAESCYFKCDIHGWMRSDVHVMKHTLFAVTNAQGEFTLPKLPAGEYEIAVMHHKWKHGKTKAKVTVAANGTATVELSLKK